MRKNNFKIAIIGAGPSGIACAIQLKRFNIDFTIFEKDIPGGLIKNANLIENYPGFPKGIKGEKMSSLLIRHLKEYKIGVINENVENVDYIKNFIIKTNKRKYFSELLIIASGTKPRKFEIDIPPYANEKIFYEINNLKSIKKSRIAIIGSGDVAFDYALSLCKKNKIYLLNRGKYHKCLDSLFERVIINQNIKYFKNFDVKEIKFLNEKILLISKNDFSINVDYLIIAIGRIPNLDFLSDKMRKKIKILENKKKLFMIGDVKNCLYRQIGIAIGDGIKTAMEIWKSYENIR